MKTDTDNNKLILELYAAKDILQRLADVCPREKLAPHGFGQEPEFIGCTLYRSDDPGEYCLSCEARKLLGKREERRLMIRLCSDDLEGFKSGNGETHFGFGVWLDGADFTVVVVPPPVIECMCGTMSWAHERGVPEACEMYKHHCESCHERKACTIPECGFERTP